MPLPTLYIKGMYEFPKGVELNENDKKLLDLTPIDIVCNIYKQKLEKTGIENRLHILESFTGSGKSTVLPSEIYKQVLDNKAVLVAEPRINLCDNAANDILNYYSDWSYGKEISVHTGNKYVKSSERKYMEFCTTQIIQNFLNKVIKSETPERYLKKYQIIIVDEAHILEIQTLSVIASIKMFLNKFADNIDCPIFVFASATLDPKRFLNYFNINSNLKYVLSTVKGVPNFPIKEIIISDELIHKLNEYNNLYFTLSKNFYDTIYPTLDKSESYVEIMNKKIQCRDVLIFVPGIKAIIAVCEGLNKLIKDKPIIYVSQELKKQDLINWRHENKNKKRVLIMGYSASYSQLSLDLLSKPYEDDFDVLENETKIIVSTSVIETGKTIQTLYICIDTGIFVKTIYNPLIYEPNTNFLIQLPINQSQRTQRKGRVGRKAPGIFIQYYSSNVYESMIKNDIPETVNMGCLSSLIYTMNLSIINDKCVLDIPNLNDYLYPISPDLLICSLNDLFFAHLIGINGEWLNEEIDEQWIIYARLAYYIIKLPLFTSILLASINRYNLPPIYQVKNFNLETYKTIFKHTFESITETKYMKALDFIPPGRKLFKDIVEGKNKAIIPYRGDFY